MRRTLTAVIFTGFLIFAAGGVLSGATDVGSGGSSILEPASGALLGQFYGAGTIDQTTQKLGRTPAIHLTYYRWESDWTGTVT